ncbi:hypothetical protein IC582_004898 [Cucumis melo]|uniref:BTB/POZ domain-containing protein At1g21780 n=1 Tax=Cucumis melo TaxID=3656 RepID=A0A1S3CT65_CUCME|nr:BTB/POZ domain-containing protein At1g21780 [Cucumis melo]
MVDSRVDTISRLAQWRIDSLGPCNFKKSDPFKLGIWNWHLSVEKSRYLHIRLFPEPSKIAKEQPPIARFYIRVSSVGPNRRPTVSPINEKLLRTSEDFVWAVDSTFHGRFIVDVEFLDLRICPMNGLERGEASSIWPMEGLMQSVSSQSTLQCLARMLDEAIHADVTIKTIDGTLQAHKAILSVSSPVFKSMFHHNLKEKESSIIFIEDMTLEACMALLRYLYGTITEEHFWKHRLSLLQAANKYGIVDLKDACEESLLEDINSTNVLGRLQEAWLYQLHKLKKRCLAYLFDFGKVYDIRDELNDFFRQADRELMMEMFQEVLTVWKPV